MVRQSLQRMGFGMLTSCCCDCSAAPGPHVCRKSQARQAAALAHPCLQSSQLLRPRKCTHYFSCIMGTCPHSSQTETLRCRAPTRTSRDPSHAGPARTKHHADILPHGRPRTVMAFTWIKLLNFTTSARAWNRPLCEAGNRLFPRRHAFGACSTRFLPADQTESRTE
jgi:hypothetical protein